MNALHRFLHAVAAYMVLGILGALLVLALSVPFYASLDADPPPLAEMVR